MFKTLQQLIVQYFKDGYTTNGRVPSVRNACEKFKLDTKSFYEIFAEGKRGALKLAGIPEDRKSFERIEKAAEALRNKRQKERLENKELNVLREMEEKIAKEFKQVQAIVGSSENIKRMETTLASTPVGRKRIFANPQRLLEFSVRMIDPEILEPFRSYCRTSNLDLAAKLCEVVGPPSEFEEQANEDELSNYIGFKLDTFIMDRGAEPKQEAMQRMFNEFLRSFRCKCGRRITATFLDNSGICCPCGLVWAVKCANCGHISQFDTSRSVFHCQHCEMSVKADVHEWSLERAKRGAASDIKYRPESLITDK